MSVKKYAFWGLGLLATATVALQLATSALSVRSEIKEIMKRERTRVEVLINVLSGCAVKGLSDEKFAPILMQSQGKACMSLTQDILVQQPGSKNVVDVCYHTSNPRRCLFSVGYLRAVFELGQDPKNPKEESDLQEEIDLAYEKILAKKP
jgi:hypothetical protein